MTDRAQTAARNPRSVCRRLRRTHYRNAGTHRYAAGDSGSIFIEQHGARVSPRKRSGTDRLFYFYPADIGVFDPPDIAGSRSCALLTRPSRKSAKPSLRKLRKIAPPRRSDASVAACVDEWRLQFNLDWPIALQGINERGWGGPIAEWWSLRHTSCTSWPRRLTRMPRRRLARR
jgi:hypothetical protein